MNLREKLLALMAEVNQEVAEREELIELIAVALLTRNNLFILGKPGQAKSHSINRFRQRITGARQFERLLSKQTDEDQLFGRIDLSVCVTLSRNPCRMPHRLCPLLSGPSANSGMLPSPIWPICMPLWQVPTCRFRAHRKTHDIHTKYTGYSHGVCT